MGYCIQTTSNVQRKYSQHNLYRSYALRYVFVQNLRRITSEYGIILTSFLPLWKKLSCCIILVSKSILENKGQKIKIQNHNCSHEIHATDHKIYYTERLRKDEVQSESPLIKIPNYIKNWTDIAVTVPLHVALN